MSFNIETYKDYTILWSMADYCIVKDGVILASSTTHNPLGSPKDYIDSMIVKRKEYDRGFKEGYHSGYSDGLKDSEADMIHDRDSAYKSGYKDGKEKGRIETIAQSDSFKGYDEGFRAGEVVGRAESEHKIAELIRKNEMLERKIAQLDTQKQDIETRPENCRNRLQDEGKSYPRSGCLVSGCGGVFGGCLHEKGNKN